MARQAVGAVKMAVTLAVVLVAKTGLAMEVGQVASEEASSAAATAAAVGVVVEDSLV